MTSKHKHKPPPAPGPPKYRPGTPLVCSRCHKPGGTLIKVDNNQYIHMRKCPK